MYTMDVKKMSNYSITEQEENETLVFFFGVCLTNLDEEEKNGRCFMTFHEALDYFESLEIEDGWIKRFDEFFINSDENTIGVYGNVQVAGDMDLLLKSLR